MTCRATDDPGKEVPGRHFAYYNSEDDDVCAKLGEMAIAAGTSMHRLLAANNLDVECGKGVSLTMGQQLFVPDSQLCVLYELHDGDTCESVGAERGVAARMIEAWNLELGAGCERIGFFADKNYTVCVSEPGVNPYSKAKAQTTPVPVP